MKIFLRFSFMAIMAMVGLGGFAQEVTLDFTATNWGLPQGSKNKQQVAKSFTNGTYTVTLEAASSGYYQVSYKEDNYLMLGKSGATLTLPAFTFDVERIDVVGRESASAAVKQNIFVGDEAVSTETKGAQGTMCYTIAADKQAAGTIYKLKVLSAHNTQVTKIMVWKKGTAPSVVTPQVDNIAAFKAIGKGKTAVLKLTNAQVQGVDGKNIFVADATGGIEFFASNQTWKAGDVLNGTIKGIYNEYKGMPELTDESDVSVTVAHGNIAPLVFGLDEVASAANLCRLVQVTGVKLEKDGNNLYATLDGDKLLIFDHMKLLKDIDMTSENHTVTGLLEIYGSTYQLVPTTVQGVVTGIDGVKADVSKKHAAVRYNLAGQRVGIGYRGVVIVHGKKLLAQ